MNIVFITVILLGSSFFLSCIHRLKSLTGSPSDLEKDGDEEPVHSFKFFRALAPEKVANVYDKFMFCATYRK